MNQLHRVSATADVVLRVPRGAAGDLERGATRLLERIDAVERVDECDVTGLSPTLNDLRVDATVRVTVGVDGPVERPTATVRETLDGGFGVQAVSVTRTAARPDG
ncbi:hypothetical protein ACFQH6_03885 [Halobacteriaceae archaeon GCM10025711]